jgi:hypothetical protein
MTQDNHGYNFVDYFFSKALNVLFSSAKRVSPAIGRWIDAPSNQYKFRGVESDGLVTLVIKYWA